MNYLKNLILFIAIAIAGAALAGCGTPAVNTHFANANTDPMAGLAGPPTLEALKELEAKAFDAHKNGDGKFFEGFLTDKFAMSENGRLLDKAATIKGIAEQRCDIKSFSFSDERLTKVGAATALITMKVTADGTCEGQKMPSPFISASLYVRNGTEWQAAWHGEDPIVDPKAPPVAKEAPKVQTRVTTSDGKPLNEDGKSLTAPTADAKPAANAETKALAAIEMAVWEAWRVRDVKKLNELTAPELAFVNIFGGYYARREDTLKNWAENPCEIKHIASTDQSSIPVTGDTSLFFHRATADGTCYGQKVGPIFGTSIYVKDSSGWKLAFTMNQPEA